MADRRKQLEVSIPGIYNAYYWLIVDSIDSLDTDTQAA
jgi:hypothetical protein